MRRFEFNFLWIWKFDFKDNNSEIQSGYEWTIGPFRIVKNEINNYTTSGLIFSPGEVGFNLEKTVRSNIFSLKLIAFYIEFKFFKTKLRIIK